jgi:hypothetical protein
MANSRICSVPDCDKRHHRAGLCSAHSKRMLRHGALSPLIAEKGTHMAWLQDHLHHDHVDCLIWPFSLSPKGRGVIHFEGRSTQAHLVMCKLAHGPRPSVRHEAAHTCGQGHNGCINPKHLRWATFEENKADMVDHGTILRGEKNPHHRLSEPEAREILSLRGLVSQRELAPAVRSVPVGHYAHPHETKLGMALSEAASGQAGEARAIR